MENTPNGLPATGTDYVISRADQDAALKGLEGRTDAEAARIKRYLAMPDLSRTAGSPLHEIIERVLAVPQFAGFDTIDIPEVVPVDVSFDLFGFAADHPARSKSDTYYVDDTHILRTHDTVMWYYYFNHPEIKQRMAEKKPVGVICYGKVYRKDEIDRHHMNIFHQMGGVYMVSDEQGIMALDDLKAALVGVAQGIFGKDVKYRFNEDTFPYTDPSLEMEIEINGRWVEMLGGGMPKKAVMANFGVTGYNGWAFGAGIERWAIVGMQLPDIRLLWSEDPRVKGQLKLGTPFVEVSKYPPVIRDISFVVDKSFVPNNYFDLIRDIGGTLIEEVHLTDSYENDEKFGAGKISYAYRITYRNLDRTLTNEEVDVLHKKIEAATTSEYSATVR